MSGSDLLSMTEIATRTRTSTYAFTEEKYISHDILKALHDSKQPLREELTQFTSFLEHKSYYAAISHSLSSLSERLSKRKKEKGREGGRGVEWREDAYSLSAPN